MGGIYTRWLVEDTAYTGFQGRKLGQDHRHLVDHLGRLEQILCSIPRAGVFPVNWAGALHSVGFIGFAVGLAALGTASSFAAGKIVCANCHLSVQP